MAVSEDKASCRKCLAREDCERKDARIQYLSWLCQDMRARYDLPKYVPLKKDDVPRKRR